MAEASNAWKIGCAILMALCFAVIVFCEFVLPNNPKSAASESPPPEAPVKQELSAVLMNCQPDGHIRCEDDLFQKKWLRLIAADGEITKVDTNFRRSNGGTVAFVYSYPAAGRMFDPSRLRRLLFDCAGHYMDITGPAGPEMDAPPLSIAGRIATMACAK